MQNLFKNLTLVDGILAVAFIVVVALLVNSMFPPNGWMIGVVASLVLLFLAKRRRDKLQNPPS
jgi:hypothetical protein